jgi:hypothetical protein
LRLEEILPLQYMEPKHPGLEAYVVSYTTKVRFLDKILKKFELAEPRFLVEKFTVYSYF